MDSTAFAFMVCLTSCFTQYGNIKNCTPILLLRSVGENQNNAVQASGSLLFSSFLVGSCTEPD